MGYKIISKIELSENLYEIKVIAPYVVKNAAAGQFIILRVDKEGERVPLTIADFDKDKNELTIVFMAVGYSTKRLAQLQPGQEIQDISGPLGIPTEIKNYGTVVCVAGGYGAAPAYLIAKAFKEAGNKVYIIVGARNGELIFWQDRMKSVSDRYFRTTNDGSLGRKGLVTDVFSADARNGLITKDSTVVSCGPFPSKEFSLQICGPP